MMNFFPISLLGPEAKVVIAGFPVGKIVGHHAPSAASPDDVENAIVEFPR